MTIDFIIEIDGFRDEQLRTALVAFLFPPLALSLSSRLPLEKR